LSSKSKAARESKENTIEMLNGFQFSILSAAFKQLKDRVDVCTAKRQTSLGTGNPDLMV
jgi:hypothetical protein